MVPPYTSLRSYLIGLLLGISEAFALPLFGRDNTIDSFSSQAGIHQAAALSALSLLVTAHTAVLRKGFTLARGFWSTDTYIGFALCALATVWTTLVFLSGWFSDEQVCRNGYSECLGRAAYVPWLMQIFSIYWLISLADAVYYQETRRKLDETLKEEEYKQREKKSNRKKYQWSRFLQLRKYKVEKRDKEKGEPGRSDFYERKKGRKVRIGLWDLSAGELEGPFGWATCGNFPYLLSLYLMVLTAIGITSYGAIKVNNYSMALLNLTGLVLFAFGAVGGNNKYVEAPHAHQGDNLRIPLHTSHRSGTVYILPSKGHGLDAVWTPKIQGEYQECDVAVEAMSNALMARDGKYRVPTSSLRKVLGPFVQKAILSNEQVNDLARWLYQAPGVDSEMKKICCKIPSGIHLIGNGLAFALMHAEYLIFQNNWRLTNELKDCLFTLRNPKRSGLIGISTEKYMVGSGRSEPGYVEVANYVYSLFGFSKAPPEAIDLVGEVPVTSVMFEWNEANPPPSTITEYRDQLWKRCFVDAESTFAALFTFTQAWVYDVGQVGGMHSIPLRAWSKQGDLTAWKIVWRQGWYQVVGAQIITMAPVIFSAFIAGILG